MGGSRFNWAQDLPLSPTAPSREIMSPSNMSPSTFPFRPTSARGLAAPLVAADSDLLLSPSLFGPSVAKRPAVSEDTLNLSLAHLLSPRRQTSPRRQIHQDQRTSPQSNMLDLRFEF